MDGTPGSWRRFRTSRSRQASAPCNGSCRAARPSRRGWWARCTAPGRGTQYRTARSQRGHHGARGVERRGDKRTGHVKRRRDRPERAAIGAIREHTAGGGVSNRAGSGLHADLRASRAIGGGVAGIVVAGRRIGGAMGNLVGRSRVLPRLPRLVLDVVAIAYLGRRRHGQDQGAYRGGRKKRRQCVSHFDLQNLYPTGTPPAAADPGAGLWRTRQHEPCSRRRPQRAARWISLSAAPPRPARVAGKVFARCSGFAYVNQSLQAAALRLRPNYAEALRLSG